MMKVFHFLMFLTVFTAFNHVSPAQSDKALSSADMLTLGRELIKQERWVDARKQFSGINKRRKGGSRLEKAEVNFSYGLCLEKLGKTDDAIKVYNAVIAVYGSYVTWSSQSLERGFNLAYQATEPEKKINAYKYLRKILYMFQMLEGLEDPSGAITRMRKRQYVVRKELGLTPEEDAAIDLSLGIRPEDRKNAQENEKKNE